MGDLGGDRQRFTAQVPWNTGRLCDCGFSVTATGIPGAGSTEVFNAAPCKPTALPREVVRKDQCRFRDGFLKFS